MGRMQATQLLENVPLIAINLEWASYECSVTPLAVSIIYIPLGTL